VSEFSAGGDHRAFVGPPDQYDVIGAAQFALLYALGLREHHRLLDIGCGSLRGGRMLIPYLAPGGYVGVDPNAWLIDAAIEEHLGRDVLAVKRPLFDDSDDFSLAHLGQFDFMLAQGIATNTGPALLWRLLRAIERALAPAGLAAVTFIHPGTGDRDAVEIRMSDPGAPDWRYPGCYSYDRSETAATIDAVGLAGRAIDWFHPRHQWWLLAPSHDVFPPEEFLATLRGTTLAEGFEASWRP
jgi:SAM-dependent methyltransferase